MGDELAAVSLLHQPDPPDVALLALDTLLVDFEQVCSSMRSAKPEVFIVALVPENRRHDLSVVLDAGADDFLIKPAVLQEAEARLRLIRRLLAAYGGSPFAVLEAEAAIQEQARSGSRRHLSQFLTGLDTPQPFTTVFRQLGLEPIREVDAAAIPDNAVHTAWGAMLLCREGQAEWMNVRIDLGQADAEALHRAVYPGTAYAESGLARLLREIMSLVQDGIRAAAREQEEAEVYLPLPPIVSRAREVPAPSVLASAKARQRSLGMELAGEMRLRITLTMESVPLETRLISDLRVLDVLAAPIQSAEYQTMLLRAGTMLNESYLDKIRVFVHSQNVSQEVHVFYPPTGTAAFLAQLGIA